MKRILLSATLCMLVSLSFGQKKLVREAKSAMNSNNLTEARDILKPALTNAETELDPETWKVAGDIENKAFDNERANEIIGKKPNEEVMYSGLYNSYDPYIKADELGQIPDIKGKVKNKYRKDIASTMKANHVYFINGGIYYNERKEFSKAANFFEKYWLMPSLSLFDDEKDKINTNDSTFQTIKYYAVICAMQAEEHERALAMLHRIAKEPFTTNSTYKESDVYELLASEYQQLGDTVNFIQSLESGASKYPKSKFFIPNLINELIKRGQADKAMAYLDQAIANDPSNSCDLYSVKASLFAEKTKFDEAYKAYNQALSADANCERALEGLAVAYIVQAQNIKEQASQTSTRKEQSEFDAKANELYKKAYPLLETYKSLLKGRNADSSEIKGALVKLQNVYYNLTMNNEYDATVAELEKVN